MNNGLDMTKYLKSINSAAALHAVNDKGVKYNDNNSDVQSNIDMQFNQDSNSINYTRFWIT